MKESSSCLGCKARRIRCDGTRPDCTRCAKYGVCCPGYADVSMIRDRLRRLSRHQAGPSACPGDVKRSPANAIQALASIGGDSLPNKDSEDSPLEIALQGLTEEFLGALSYGQQGAHLLDHHLKSPLVMNALTTIMISLAFTSLEEKAQTREQRVAAHEQYRTTLKAIQDGMEKFTHSGLHDDQEISLSLAVYLMAIFEMAVSSPDPGPDTAWRHHLAGLQSMMSQGVRLSRGENNNSETQHISQPIDLALRQLQVLSPVFDSALDNISCLRDLDVRKLRVEVRRIHRALMMAKSVQDQVLHKISDNSDSDMILYSWTKKLTLSSCLLITTHVLDHSTAHICRWKLGSWRRSAEYASLKRIRSASIACIVAECARLPGLNLDRLDTSACTAPCSVNMNPGQAPTLVDGLLVVFPLYLALSMAEAHSPQYCQIWGMLTVVAEKCCVPRAVHMLCAGGVRRMSFGELIDGLVLMSISLRRKNNSANLGSFADYQGRSGSWPQDYAGSRGPRNTGYTGQP